MTQRRRNHYSTAFKQQAVARLRENNSTLADCAQQFGITSGMLSKWSEQFAPAPTSKSNGSNVEYIAEIKRLGDELATLKKVVRKTLMQRYSDDEITDSMIEDWKTRAHEHLEGNAAAE